MYGTCTSLTTGLPEQPQIISHVHFGKRIPNKPGSSKSNRSVTDVQSIKRRRLRSFHFFTPRTPTMATATPKKDLHPPQRPHYFYAGLSYNLAKAGNNKNSNFTQPGTDCARAGPQPNNATPPAFRRNPVSSPTAIHFKDPLVERFEQLKLTQNGKLQAARPFAPAASPLSPQNKKATANLQAPFGDSLNLSRSKSDSMATARLFEPTDLVSISQPRSSSNAQPQPATNSGEKAASPNFIDLSDDEESLIPLPKLIANPFQRHTQIRNRTPKLPRQQAKSVSRRPDRQSRSSETITSILIDISTASGLQNVP